jgi:hypothetical protein
VSTQAIRIMSRNGAYKTLLDAGLVKPRRRQKKKGAAPASKSA